MNNELLSLLNFGIIILMVLIFFIYKKYRNKYCKTLA